MVACLASLMCMCMPLIRKAAEGKLAEAEQELQQAKVNLQELHKKVQM